MRESLVHVKFYYEQALKAKKDILEMEMLNLNAQKFLKRYTEIRKDELKLKIKLQQKMSLILADLKKLKEQLPSAQLPEAIRKRKEEIRKEVQEKGEYSKDIEFELERIKEKLRGLQRS